MDPRENLLRVYKELADWYERQRQPPMRDRFLVLAADAALLANRPDETERLRLRLLKVNPHHMLKPYASFAQALKAPDVLTYVKDLRVNYPANVAEDLLRTLQAEDKPPANPIPVTAPLIDLRGSPLASPSPVAEDEVFFHFKEPEPDLAPTAPPGSLGVPFNRKPLRSEALPRTLPLQGAATPYPVQPAARTEPVRAPRPVPAVSPLDPRPVALGPAAEPAAGTAGSWLAVLLFLLVLACGAVLAGFTFLRPYLPTAWLP